MVTRAFCAALSFVFNILPVLIVPMVALPAVSMPAGRSQRTYEN
jgi:hypothetical protein